MAKQDEDEGKNIGENNEIENGPLRPRLRQQTKATAKQKNIGHPKHSNNLFPPHIGGKVAKICFRNSINIHSIIMPFLPGALSFRFHRIALGIKSHCHAISARDSFLQVPPDSAGNRESLYERFDKTIPPCVWMRGFKDVHDESGKRRQ
jgi:hypothetical protein